MFIVTLVSLSHSELVPFVYVYGMFVCLYSPDQNQMLAHDMINLYLSFNLKVSLCDQVINL